MPNLKRKRYKPRRFDPTALSPNQAGKILLLSRKGLSDRETAAAVQLGVSGCLETASVLDAEVRRLLGS